MSLGPAEEGRGGGKRGPGRRRRNGGEQRKNRVGVGNAQGHEYRK